MKPIPSLAVLLFALTVVGCAKEQGARPAASDPLIGVSSGAARIGVHAVDILDAAKLSVASGQRDLIVAHANAIVLEAVDLAVQAERSNKNMQLMAGSLHNSDVKIALLEQTNDRLNHQFWSPRQVRLMWLILGIGIGSWALLGSLSVIAPLLWGGTGLTISKFIIRFLPAANLFSAARDKARG